MRNNHPLHVSVGGKPTRHVLLHHRLTNGQGALVTGRLLVHKADEGRQRHQTALLGVVLRHTDARHTAATTTHELIDVQFTAALATHAD